MPDRRRSRDNRRRGRQALAAACHTPYLRAYPTQEAAERAAARTGRSWYWCSCGAYHLEKYLQ